MSDKDKKNAVYHCLDIWAIPQDVLKLPPEERAKVIISTLVRSSTEKHLIGTRAPISLPDQALAIGFLFLALGGPILWLLVTFYMLIFGSWTAVLVHVVVSLILAFHPMPQRDSKFVSEFVTCRITLALYKYFSYRMVWTDNAWQEGLKAAPWIGAGPPHGVLPFANILSMPAMNSVLGINFAGAPASVVFYTPFLRYLTLYPSVHVGRHSIAAALKQETSVGTVPDGIKGIFCQSPHVEVVALQNRKGIARLALRENIPVFPAYSFGNTAAFSSWWDPFGIMEQTSRKLQASMFIYWGRFGLPIPRRVPITMVFGKPIYNSNKGEPTEEQIDDLHQKLLTAISNLFECHKESYGWGDKELVFV